MSKVRCWACVGTGEIFFKPRNSWMVCNECDGLGEIDYNPEDYAYATDEWHDDSDGHYYTGTCEECFGTGYDARGAACEYCGGSGYDMSGDSPTLPLPPFMADERNLIKRIVSFVAVLFRRVFRRDSLDQIPF